MAECWGTAQEGARAGIMLEAYEVTREQGAILATEGNLQEREVGCVRASQRAMVRACGEHWAKVPTGR